MADGFFGRLFGHGDTEPEVVATAPVDEAAAEVASAAADLDALRSLVRRSGAALPTIVSSRLRQIDDLLRVVLDAAATKDASTEQRYLLTTMIRDYIPTPLHSYLALPDADRTDAARPTTLLLDQFAVLEETIHDLLNQIRIGAIAELSTHGRFLADKFNAPSLVLDAPAPSAP